MAGDEGSALTGFLFYAFIVHPATAWILRPGRFERKKSILYAIGFLATLAAIKTGMYLRLTITAYLDRFCIFFGRGGYVRKCTLNFFHLLLVPKPFQTAM
jgi:hypothetical protein